MTSEWESGSKERIASSDKMRMGSLDAVTMQILAASRSEGLSPDAIRSLGELAASLSESDRRLEDVLDTIEPNSEAEAIAVERMRKAIENGPYLD